MLGPFSFLAARSLAKVSRGLSVAGPVSWVTVEELVAAML